MNFFVFNRKGRNIVAFFLFACYNKRMKKDTKNSNATHFPIRPTKTVWILGIAVVVLCIAAIVISVWRICQFGINGFTDVIKYPFLILVCLFGIALILSVWLKSEYVIDKEYLWLKYGFIPNRYNVKDITAIVQDTDLQKLSIYFNEQYSVITIQPDWFEKFVRALLAVNPHIDYSFTLTDTPDGE